MKSKNPKQNQQLEDLQKGWQRTQADFDNYKKRIEQEKISWREQGKTESFSQILPLLDNISLALNHIPQDISDNSWVQGIIYIGKQIDQELSDLNIEKIVVRPGDHFDHNLHEAIEVRSDKSYNSDEVIEIKSDGYSMNGKIIRPARVVVCKND